MEEQLAKLVEKAIEVAEKTGEFAIQQAPLLLQEFYTWHLIKESMWVVLTIVQFLIFKKIFVWLGDKNPGHDKNNWFTLSGKWYNSDSEWVIFYMIGWAVPFLMMVSRSCVGIMNIIQILVAPKLYLIEHFIK